MLPFLFPLTLTIALILITLCILIRQCFSSDSPKKISETIRYSYPSRTCQRDYKPTSSNPCINYIQRKSTYRGYISDNDSQDESSDFVCAEPSHLTSNIRSQKGGFKYNIKNEEHEKELSPQIPSRF